jgi:hypothetical protein
MSLRLYKQVHIIYYFSDLTEGSGGLEMWCSDGVEALYNLPCDPLNIKEQQNCLATIIKFTVEIISVAVQKQFEVTAKLLQEYRGLFGFDLRASLL